MKSSDRTRLGWIASLIAVTAIAFGACCMWSLSMPGPGERTFEWARVWSPRCAAIALWLFAHAILLGVAMPLIYRPRAVYTGAAICSGGAGLLGSVSAVALLLASR